MNTVHGPAFASPELQTAIDKARETLEGADEARNQVSRDIKALEGYLVGLGLTVPFRYSLGKMFVPDDEQSATASLELSGSAGGKIEEEAFVLDENTNGKVRLFYEVSQWEGCVDVDSPGGPLFWSEDTLEREVKPLIETKFEIRKRVFGRLPAFVAALAQHYAIDPSKLDLGDDEIPF